MNKLNTLELSGAVAIVGGAFSHFIGAINIPLEALFICMAVDYITGIMKAVYTKQGLSSRIGFRGLMKKFAILFVVILAHQLGQVINQPMLRDGACLFYIANEGISILENTFAMGGSVPKWLKVRLKTITEKESEENGGQ